jgi:hypothetical protein
MEPVFNDAGELHFEPLVVLPTNSTEATGVFVCNGSSVASGLNSNGQNVVANNGGPDGFTSVTGLVGGAKKFATTFSATHSATAATKAANAFLGTSPGHGAEPITNTPYKIPYNDKGDKLVRIPKPR